MLGLLTTCPLTVTEMLLVLNEQKFDLVESTTRQDSYAKRQKVYLIKKFIN